ncbi:MAG: DUF262 domain-containing protein [Nitrosopumilus sp.]|nr:DUF262 domain-containing protein [Nitrosopumilus sp.]MDH3384928.1 DUF262 domain-containing protein [Nitrosopumilus sp.]
MWKDGDIEIPEFQRSYVWTISQASRLIESFLMGLPIPPVFFYIDENQKNLVIDGRQRLQSIFYFFEGYFKEADTRGNRKEFALEGINPSSKWYKKKFSDFDDPDQRQLKNTVLRTVLVKQINPKQDHTSIYHIFERLNTGGTALQDQEVRNCVFGGKLNDLLSKLNDYENWRFLLGKNGKDPRQKDVQLILRYMALFHDLEIYKRPMKDFLSKFMDKNTNPPISFIEAEQNRFQKVCDLIVSHLGKDRPLNPKGPLNPSVVDSVMIAFAKHLDSCPSDISSRVERLRSNPEFQKLISKATTDQSTVNNRLKLAERELFG